MKRTILALAAMATLVACSKDEIVDVSAPTPISFGEAFVDNSTRAIDATLNNDNLDSFQVYGTVTGTGGNGTGEGTVNIFNGVTVNKTKQDNSDIGDASENTWWYSAANTQYWIPDNTYEFAAVENATSLQTVSASSMPEVIRYQATAENLDLLYAEATATGKANGSNTPVMFTFDHLLSKVQFTFENTITTNTNDIMYTYVVSDLKITNAYALADYTIGNYVTGTPTNGTWEAKDGVDNDSDIDVITVDFGHITNVTDANATNTAIPVGQAGAKASATSHHARVIIPGDYTGLKITGKIQTLLNEAVIDTNPIDITADVELEAGKAYNFKISKGAPGDKIMFGVTAVKGWDPAGGGTDISI